MINVLLRVLGYFYLIQQMVCIIAGINKLNNDIHRMELNATFRKLNGACGKCECSEKILKRMRDIEFTLLYALVGL